MRWIYRAGLGLVAALASVAIALTGSSSSAAPSHARTGALASRAVAAMGPKMRAEIKLYTSMRQLWSQHMEWTYSTVDAFFHNPKALQPTLNRLLQNQRDIGAAIVPFYGKTAGHRLTRLLLTHIEDAVPVLKAAKSGNSAGLNKAVKAWYANADQIAEFLSAANPKSWPLSATRPMMREHITQTITYSVDLLKGHYARAIVDYGRAENHMAMMADTLSRGIVAQFPGRFSG